MGKKGKKARELQKKYDGFFDKDKPAGGDGWVSGVSAMMLDDEQPGPGPGSSAPAGEGASATAAATDMETGEGGRSGKAIGLGVQKINMKAVRGQATRKQKIRKQKQAEKATARNEKATVKGGVRVAQKQKKCSLKSIY